MAIVKVYNNEGAQAGELELSSALFDVAVNTDLVYEAVRAQTANSRMVIAHAKDRSEVRGGGRKPWKQKGTGRARHGSRRSPIWSGGGVTFGPSKIRNFAMKLNRKAKRKALAMVLSDKVTHEKIIVLENLALENGKTKELAAVLAKLPSAGKKVLIVTKPENKAATQPAKNLENVATLPANCLNIVDLLRYEYVVITKDAIDFATELYG